jgi:hypothetical protein
MFSARIEKGPVTPRMVRGWIEKLKLIRRGSDLSLRVRGTCSD